MSDDVPDVPAELADSLRIVKELKGQTVRHGGDPDLAPMLELRRDGVLLHAAVLDGERDRVLALLHDLVVLSDADQAVMIADTFILNARHHPGEHGDLAARFAAGDLEVYEALSLVSCEPTGRELAVTVPFTRRRRRIRWGEPKVDGVESGAMIQALRVGFARQVLRRKEGPVPPMQEVANHLGIALLAVQLSPPPRNKPCPCGSGDKAKFCCWK